METINKEQQLREAAEKFYPKNMDYSAYTREDFIKDFLRIADLKAIQDYSIKESFCYYKLRDDFDKLIFDFCGTKERHSEILRNRLLERVFKSEAAKAYHEQSDIENDLDFKELLKHEVCELYESGGLSENGFHKLMDMSNSDFQPQQKQCDAVEFATYLSTNNWESSNGIMYNKFRNEYGSKYIITTEHIDNLYQRFLTSKTK